MEELKQSKDSILREYYNAINSLEKRAEKLGVTDALDLDINPRNAIIDPKTGKVKFIDIFWY